jgi:hypothetical protein
MTTPVRKVPDDGTPVVWGRYIATRHATDDGDHIEVVAGPGANAWPTAPFVRLDAESGELYLFGALLPDPLQLTLPISTPGDIDTLVAAFAKYPGYALSADEADVLARWLAGDRDAFFWADVEAAGLIHTEPTSADAAALRYMPTSVGMIRDIGKSPLFSPRPSGQLAIPDEQIVGSLNKRPFGITAPAGWPTPRDGMVIAEVLTILNARKADPKDSEARKLYGSGRFFGELNGYGPGGWQLERSAQQCARMRSFTIRFLYNPNDGEPETRVGIQGLIESADVGGNGGYIQATEWALTQMQAGILSFYNLATLRALIDRNEHAATLWQWVESLTVRETPKPWATFSSAPGEPPDLTRQTPAVADVLNLREKRFTKDGSGWSRRRDIVRHIRADAADLMDMDPRYTVVVKPAKHRGMWNVWVSKVRVPELAPPVDNPPEPCTTSRADRVPRVAPTVYHESREVCTTSRAPDDGSGTAPSLEAGNSISSLSVFNQSSEDQERAGAAAPRLSRDSFETFWSAYPRQEQSHKDKASRAFAKLSDDDRAAATSAAEHVAVAVAAGTLPIRYTRQPENFLRDVFRDWQDGPPAAYRKDGHLADVLEAGALAFDLLTCYVCATKLTADEHADETLTTHDGTGWRHVACSPYFEVERA